MSSHRVESLTRSKVVFDPLSPPGSDNINGISSGDSLDSHNHHPQQHRPTDHSQAVVTDRKIHTETAAVINDLNYRL